MMFYLTTLNWAKFITENEPKLSENESDSTTVVAMDAWKHSDFVCKNYNLNGWVINSILSKNPLIMQRHYGKLWIKSTSLKMRA